MQGLVITNRLTERYALTEINELISPKKISKENCIVKFSLKDYDELCKISYRSQSINRACLLICEFEVDKVLKKTMKHVDIQGFDFSEWISKDKKYQVQGERHGTHDFNSVEISTEIGKKIHGLINEKYGISAQVDYDEPDVSFYVFVHDNKGYLGVDFCGMDVSKRQYKIFNHPQSLKASTAYALVRESGFRGSETLIDPFMGSGMIVIEAALFASKFPVRYYEKDKLAFTKFDFFDEKMFEDPKKQKTKIFGYDQQLRFLKATKKNAKLAGVNDILNLSKIDIGWLDTKFERGSIDMIVSDPPRPSKHKDNNKLLKLYKELFYQAEFVLADKGAIVLLSPKHQMIEKAAGEHGFKAEDVIKIYQGQQMFEIIKVVKK